MEIAIYSIGLKIREHRKQKKIKLDALVKMSGISQPMLSKIENGRVLPTIQNLFSILNSLEIDPSIFFSELMNNGTKTKYIHIPSSNYKQYVKEETAIGFLYKSIFDRNIETSSINISLVSLEPKNHRAKVATNAHEFLYIINGSIDYYLEDELIQLQEGDSLFFDGKTPHVPLNKTQEIVKYLVIYFYY